MKTIITTFFLILFSHNLVLSQDTIFFDSNWKKVYQGNYDFYRVVSPLKKLYSIKDYYASGQIQMEGLSRKSDTLIKEGLFNYYHENGARLKRVSFKKNIKNGEYELYYPNGKLKEKGEYKNDLLIGLNTQYFDNGVIMREAEFKKGKYQGNLTYYNNRGIIIGKGQTKDDGWDGNWVKYDDEGNIIGNIFYGNIIKIKEENIELKSENYIWALFERKSYNDYQSYLIRCISNINSRKDFIEDSPELNLAIINNQKVYDEFYFGIEKSKTQPLKLSDKKIRVIDSFQAKYLNNGIQETSQVYGLTDGNRWFYFQYLIKEKNKYRDEEIVSQFIESIKIN